MKKILVLLPFLFFFGCTQPDVEICDPVPGFTIYSVAEGHHDFLPNDQPTNVSIPEVEFELILDSSMYWEFNGDRDYYDISKIIGLTDRSNANNKVSAILGWRPYEDQKNHFELFAFVNHIDASFDFDRLAVVSAGQLLSGSIVWTNNKARFVIKTDGGSTYTETLNVINEDVEKYRAIGGWFGGNDTAPNDMCYWLNFTFSPTNEE